MKIRSLSAGVLTFLTLFGLLASFPVGAQQSFDLSQVAYYDRVKQALDLTSEQENMLRNYGFSVVDVPDGDDYGFSPATRFEDFYFTKVYQPDLPVFVTTDSILHLYHVVFDCSLRMIEDQTFYPMLYDVTYYAYQKSLEDFNTLPHDNSIAYWAVRNATVYFAVAMTLISGQNASVPSELIADRDFFLSRIYTDQRQFMTATYWQYPGELPIELMYDFTQFTVRGHYLGVPRLEQYFLTMMWYGNFPVFIPRNDEIYAWLTPHFDATAIVYTRDILKQNQPYYDKWMAIYDVTGVLIGESDSINPLNLESALNSVFGSRTQYLDAVMVPGGFAELSVELSKPAYEQKILGQGLLSFSESVRYPIVFQFMGQRYVPDSYIFQLLCFDKVGRNSLNERRILPKSLDVLATLGSQRADQLLNSDKDFENYTKNLAALKNTFGNMTEEEWTQSSYIAWIYCLQSLIATDYNASYPLFMRNLAWQDEKLNTACGSWAQLRHDTLLYAKQTYIPGLLCSYPEAFAEPNPTFYARMQQLSQRTIDAVQILPSGTVNSTILISLQTLKNATQQLEVISKKELNQQPLTNDEVNFLKTIVWRCGSGGFIGWYADTVHDITFAANYTSLLNAPVIADVATFPGDFEYPPQILHTAVGNVKALVVLYPLSNGTLVAAVGPVFSYYEFPLVGTKRLNDDEWKTMLGLSNSSAYLPSWVKDIYGYAEPLIPETSPAIMVLATVVVTAACAALTFKWKRHTSASNRNRLLE